VNTRLLGRAGSGKAASSLVFLLTMRHGERPCWVASDVVGTRVADTVGTGAYEAPVAVEGEKEAEEEGAVMVAVAAVVAMAVVCVCRAVGIAQGASSRAGVGFFLLVCEESKGASRPKDRPTAEAPTTVAVAQSCVTRMRQKAVWWRGGWRVAKTVLRRKGWAAQESKGRGGGSHYRCNRFHSRGDASRRGTLARGGGRGEAMGIMAWGGTTRRADGRAGRGQRALGEGCMLGQGWRKQRGGAARWSSAEGADDGLKKCHGYCLWDLRTGLFPARLGLASGP